MTKTRNKRVILNLKEARAKKDSVIIIDPEGTEFELGGISVDAYLKILDFEEQYSKIKDDEEGEQETEKEKQIELLTNTRDFITSMLPGFNVEVLYLDEVFAVFAAIQEGISAATGVPTPDMDDEKKTEGN